MDLKQPLSLNEQIERLKEHGMTIFAEEDAKVFLSQVNYYRFTGYALENRQDEHVSDYKENTFFEVIQQRYMFDMEMRHVLRKAIECAEIYYRTQISYWFTMRKCQVSPHNQHYDRNNYYMKEKFDNLMKQISKEENYYHDSKIVNHHRKKYADRMPLWVLVEIMTFSSLSKFYKCMYSSDQDAIASAVGTSAPMLSNHLHCIAVLRNKCAHAARLYNTIFSPPARLGRNFLQKYPEVRQNTLFGYIIILAQLLPDNQYRKIFIDNLITIIEHYKPFITFSKIGFPNHYQTLLKIQK